MHMPHLIDRDKESERERASETQALMRTGVWLLHGTGRQESLERGALVRGGVVGAICLRIAMCHRHVLEGCAPDQQTNENENACCRRQCNGPLLDLVVEEAEAGKEGVEEAEEEKEGSKRHAAPRDLPQRVRDGGGSVERGRDSHFVVLRGDNRSIPWTVTWHEQKGHSVREGWGEVSMVVHVLVKGRTRNTLKYSIKYNHIIFLQC